MKEFTYSLSFKDKKVDTSKLTPHHQRYCDEYKSLALDFNEIVFQYCYVVFFTPISPLVPLLSFIMIFGKKHIDVFKLFKYFNVLMIEKANGILVYNIIFRIIFYIGLVTNISILLFSDSGLNNMDNHLKLAIIFIYTHLVLFISYLFNFDFQPEWIKNKHFIEDIYEDKFYFLGKNYLFLLINIKQYIRFKGFTSF